MFRTIGESSHHENPGVYVRYEESIKKCIRELDEIGVFPSCANIHLKLKIKDGAGYQLKLKGAEYPSMELFGYVLLEVYEISDSVSSVYIV